MSPNVMKESAEACLGALEGNPFQIKWMGEGEWENYDLGEQHPTDIEWFGIDHFRTMPTQERLDQDAYNKFALELEGTDVFKMGHKAFMAGIQYAREAKQ